MLPESIQQKIGLRMCCALNLTNPKKVVTNILGGTLQCFCGSLISSLNLSELAHVLIFVAVSGRVEMGAIEHQLINS